jgi:hypothetical protein
MLPEGGLSMSIMPDKIGHKEETDKTRRLIFIVAGAIAVLLLAGLVVYLKTRPGPTAAVVLDQKLDGGIRADSPEFEKYRGLLKVDDPEGETAKSVAGGIEMRMATTVRNFTGRTIIGLEMKGSVVGLEDKVMKQRTLVVIPSNELRELESSETARVPIIIPGFKGEEGEKIESGLAKLKMEVTAVKFR